MHKLLAVVVVSCALACAKPPAAPAPVVLPFKASCRTPALGVCTEYTEAAFVLGEEWAKSSCLELRGSWSPARCPAKDTLGACARAGQRRLYYPGGDFDFSPERARSDCVELFSGEWLVAGR